MFYVCTKIVDVDNFNWFSRKATYLLHFSLVLIAPSIFPFFLHMFAKNCQRGDKRDLEILHICMIYK